MLFIRQAYAVEEGLFMALLAIVLFLLHFQGSSGYGRKVEPGFSVLTLFNGSNYEANFDAILPHHTKGDFLVLDTHHNRIWKLSSLLTQSKSISLFSGSSSGQAGYVDGDINEALYSHPHSFTMDDENNIYVADVGNYAVRKISKGIVTTIAGGLKGKSGYADGPGEDAKFSNDFTLMYWSGMLLIPDRGNRMIRVMQLKSKNEGHTVRNIIGIGAVALIVIFSIGFCAYGARRHSTNEANKSLIDWTSDPRYANSANHGSLYERVVLNFQNFWYSIQDLASQMFSLLFLLLMLLLRPMNSLLFSTGDSCSKTKQGLEKIEHQQSAKAMITQGLMKIIHNSHGNQMSTVLVPKNAEVKHLLDNDPVMEIEPLLSEIKVIEDKENLGNEEQHPVVVLSGEQDVEANIDKLLEKFLEKWVEENKIKNNNLAD